MVKARFTGVNHYHDGEKLDQGDIVELTDEQYAEWSYQFERVESPSDSEDSEENETEEPESTESPESEPSEDDSSESADEGAGEPKVETFDPGNYTIPELQSEVSEIDDEMVLTEIRKVEQSNDDRTGAKQVIDERIDEVSG